MDELVKCESCGKLVSELDLNRYSRRTK